MTVEATPSQILCFLRCGVVCMLHGETGMRRKVTWHTHGVAALLHVMFWLVVIVWLGGNHDGGGLELDVRIKVIVRGVG